MTEADKRTKPQPPKQKLTAEELEILDLSDMASPPCSMPPIEPLPDAKPQDDDE